MDFDQTWYIHLYLVLKRIWNPIAFQGQRSRSPSQIFRWGDTPRFALPLYKIVLMMQTFGIICIKWSSPKQGILTLFAACLVTLAIIFKQRVWSLLFTVLVFALDYWISSFTENAQVRCTSAGNAQVDLVIGPCVKRTGLMHKCWKCTGWTSNRCVRKTHRCWRRTS